MTLPDSTAFQTDECPLAAALASRLREARSELTAKWLERIAARVATDPNHIFPSQDLLDHVPLLIDGIADYLENPTNEIGADTPVIGKAVELGALRHSQGFDAYEILKEYEILGGILFSFLARVADEVEEPCDNGELLVCGHRVFRAISIVQETTTGHFLRLADAQVAEREDRLRAFNRAVSHEIKNQIGTILGASEVLREVGGTMTDEQRIKFVDIISNNARIMRGTVENLVALSRGQTDPRQHRHVHLPNAAAESVRQLRERAQSAGVDVCVGDLPDIEVNAAAVELALNNLVSNAIKYRDPKKDKPMVRIDGAIEDHDGERWVVVRVHDNGLGVPVELRQGLFQRFFRAHETVTRAEGTGLGLNIVRETIESLNGKAWADFTVDGTVFAFTLPLRRTSELQHDRGTAGRSGSS
ncbi:MAG: ATP-binding region ATPase domain protein [Gemmatimonadetes bacterium]|nr:ATP-binding region ATPase domain protein [Gemmatimonadota bacterium]